MTENIFNDSIVLIDKPAGITSFDSISRFKKIVGIKKVGHSGTLDKFATGLLIVGTGKATKLTRYFLESDKEYEGLILLGKETDTCDVTGEVISEGFTGNISEDQIREALQGFLGESRQLPPEYSSLKINGKRASDLARKGESVSLEKRPITVYGIDPLVIDLKEGTVRFKVSCSKGTYIRSIARDLGRILGCGACLKELRRTGSGHFSVDNAASLDEIKDVAENRDGGKSGFVLRPEEALSHFGKIYLSEEASARVLNGAYFTREQVDQLERKNGDLFLLFDNRHSLIAIVEIDIESWKINFHSVFNN